MSHHWTPLSMVSRSVRPHEWRMGDKREELGWIRLVEYQGQPTFVCVTQDEWIVGCGDTLRDAAEAFLTWKRGRT
ncbi:hypothetical protein C5C30_02210 [Rathayibacter sp. AY2B5]|nr:hypothetical protein C5C30_02210 [Rathayibacter sp. AY2B5]